MNTKDLPSSPTQAEASEGNAPAFPLATGSALPSPEEFAAAAKVLRWLALKLMITRSRERWWQKILWQYDTKTLLKTADLFEDCSSPNTH